MNTRILELLKNPELIEDQDLNLLNPEIEKYPFIQNIRALKLIGTNKFNKDDYQKVLSETAAYTTDKKILYQLINKKSESSFIEDKSEKFKKINLKIKSEKFVEESSDEVIIDDVPYNDVPHIPKPVANPVSVNGVLNRILFEGEEDFLERETENIDIESTLEAGKLVTQKSGPSEEISTLTPEIIKKEDFTEVAEAENFTVETVIKEEEILQEKEIIEDSAEISFHGSEEFLPEITIKSTNTELPVYKAPKPQLSKHEEEMQRLIAEVEAKMKSSKKEKIKAEKEVILNHDVNFSKTQDFEILKTKTTDTVNINLDETFKKPEIDENNSEIKKPETKEILKPEINDQNEKPVWKPMNFSDENKNPPVEKVAEKIEEKVEIQSDQTEKENSVAEESNVPVFINTWQNWLKIERKEVVIDQRPRISKEDIKNTVIEKFIEKEPRISKLKEESDFVVKDKGSNISHLMTETLANLYVAQKLYSKAIKAYETLIEKHPQKKELFESKIKELKELRKNA